MNGMSCYYAIRKAHEWHRTLYDCCLCVVFLTSNNTRELSDALKRRCLHLYIPFPDIELERRIIQTRVPEVPENIRKQLVAFVHELRELDLKKHPAISETIDWARALLLLHADRLDEELVRTTLNVLLKHEEDIENVNSEVGSLISKALKGIASTVKGLTK